jgi:hypothetical protein
MSAGKRLSFLHQRHLADLFGQRHTGQQVVYPLGHR